MHATSMHMRISWQWQKSGTLRFNALRTSIIHHHQGPPNPPHSPHPRPTKELSVRTPTCRESALCHTHKPSVRDSRHRQPYVGMALHLYVCTASEQPAGPPRSGNTVYVVPLSPFPHQQLSLLVGDNRAKGTTVPPTRVVTLT